MLPTPTVRHGATVGQMGQELSQFFAALEGEVAGTATFEGGRVRWDAGYTLIKRGGVAGVGVAIYDGTVEFDLDACRVEIEVSRVDLEHRVSRVTVEPVNDVRMTGRTIRSTSIGRLMDRAMRSLTVPVVSDAEGRLKRLGHPGDPDRELKGADVSAAQKATAADRRFALLQHVAEAYREAIEHSLPTSRTICQRVPAVPSETAARQRVREARRAGLLRATDRGRKGEN